MKLDIGPVELEADHPITAPPVCNARHSNSSAKRQGFTVRRLVGSRADAEAETIALGGATSASN